MKGAREGTCNRRVKGLNAEETLGTDRGAGGEGEGGSLSASLKFLSFFFKMKNEQRDKRWGKQGVQQLFPGIAGGPPPRGMGGSGEVGM